MEALAPGSIAQWLGNEIFSTAELAMKGVQRCPAGGIALLVSVLKGNNEGYVEWFAYVIVNGQVGWAPTNWVDKIV